MPVIKSAKKKLRQDKKATLRNAKAEAAVKDAVKAARKNPSEKTLKVVFSVTDKAAKRGILHKNKAARIKSSVSKLLSSKRETTKEAPKAKKTTAKKSK